MCGIAGYAGLDNPALLREMCDSIAHRGPDDEGVYAAPGVGLARNHAAAAKLDVVGMGGEREHGRGVRRGSRSRLHRSVRWDRG